MENIPEGLNYSEDAPFHLPLFHGWMNLLNMAKKSVDIVSSHWDLNHTHPSACQVSHILYDCDGFVCILHSLLSLPSTRTDQLSFQTPPSFPQRSWTVTCLHVWVDVPLLVTRHSVTTSTPVFFRAKSCFIFVYKRLSVQCC